MELTIKRIVEQEARVDVEFPFYIKTEISDNTCHWMFTRLERIVATHAYYRTTHITINQNYDGTYLEVKVETEVHKDPPRNWYGYFSDDIWSQKIDAEEWTRMFERAGKVMFDPIVTGEIIG